MPGLLRSLLSSDDEERRGAIYELFGNIWHQGTVYEATAAAVPFLYELLDAPGVTDKSSIALLLACIADGRGYYEVHARAFGESHWRKSLRSRGKTLEGELKREAAEVGAARRSISQGLSLLRPYLRDDDPDVRKLVAAALGNFPEQAEQSLAELRAAEAAEVDEEVLKVLRESIERLSRR